MKWYSEQWENSLKQDIEKVNGLIEINKHIEEQNDTIKKLSILYEQVVKILQAYHCWDPIFLEFMKKNGINYSYNKGPATLYLETVGLIEKKEETKKVDDVLFDELKKVENIKGKN
jgi:hypothetical protein